MADSIPQELMDAIAVIGMAGRFPGAADLETFWSNLCAGVESVSDLSDEELEAAGVPASLYRRPGFVRRAALLDDVEFFDPNFFGFNPREAELMDPQHRLFLESAWQALETAGYDPRRYPGRVAVFAGASVNTYAIVHIYRNPAFRLDFDPMQMAVAVDKDYLPTLTSFKLGLRGPSVGIQTACSTALVSAHLACQSLLTYQSDMALAGAVTVKIPQTEGYPHLEGGVLSPDGHCRAFDARAAGTVFGSGLGVVVLKRLEDALEDGDVIEAVIRGSAINNDGALKVGYTAPSLSGQAEVVATAHAMAEVEPATIGYVEAHGTGTALGDPVEVAALKQAFGSDGEAGSCALGSVKTNIGHLDTAAGAAGLIKAVLALKHRQIPPSLHFESPNPALELDGSPFFVNDRLRSWSSDDGPRRAGVSSFGVGGTNAHLVLEEAPPRRPSGPSRKRQLLLVSAFTEAALERMTSNLGEHLAEHRPALADAAFTLHRGRRRFRHRRALVVEDLDQAAKVLSGAEPRRLLTAMAEDGERPVAFLFPGQGSQYPGMARGLYRDEAVFRRELDRCSQILQRRFGLDLKALLFGDSGTFDDLEEARRRLQRTDYAQPALFSVEYALARLWMAWGIEPDAFLGHSLGEFVAACLAGVFGLEDALALVVRRGRLMQELEGGAMLSVALPEAAVVEHLAGLDETRRPELAAINGPAMTVITGTEDAVAAAQERLEAAGVQCRPLHTAHGFHSRLVEPAVEAFAAEVARVELQAPSIPFLSNVTGTWITEEQARDLRYWATQMRRPVRFAEGLEHLLTEPRRVLVEVGPGHALRTFARAHPSWQAQGGLKESHDIVLSLPHAREAREDQEVLLENLGRLWLAGLEPRWSAFYDGEERHRVALPTYPFERRRCWIEVGGESAAVAASAPGTVPVRRDVADWLQVPVWRQSMAPRPPRDGAVAGERWLVLGEVGELTAAVASRLRRLGAETVLAGPGQGAGEGIAGSNGSGSHGLEGNGSGSHSSGRDASATASPAYALRWDHREDYLELLRRLRDDGGLPERVVHLGPAAANGDDFEAAESTAFTSLLYLAQALGDVQPDAELGLYVVSTGQWRVGADKESAPAKALLRGPVLVLPREYPGLRCRSLDFGIDAPAAELADELAAELVSDRSEPFVAYRGGRRQVRALEQVRIEEEPGNESGLAAAHPLLKHRGVYLITGGLGGIGLTLARRLAQQVSARLVLVGRTVPPAEEEWGDFLARHDADHPLVRKIALLRQLQEQGAEVLAVGADVTDAQEARAAVLAAEERFGALDGVIHAAGVPGGGIVQLKTLEEARRIMAPKVAGARHLAAALDDREVDFLVLLSSTLALVGEAGQVDYSAANAFLDAFAESRHGGPWTLSMGWDLWQDVGMGAGALAGTSGTSGAPSAPDNAGAASAGMARASADPLDDLVLGPSVRLSAEPHPEPQDVAATNTAANPATNTAAAHPWWQQRSEAAGEAVFRSRLKPAEIWLLDQHRMGGVAVMPGVGILEMVRGAWQELTGEAVGVELKEVFFQQPLRFAGDEARAVRLTLPASGEGRFRFEAWQDEASEEGDWQPCASGRVAPLSSSRAAEDSAEAGVEAGNGSGLAAEGESVAELVGAAELWGPRWSEIEVRRLVTDQSASQDKSQDTSQGTGQGAGRALMQVPAASAAEIEALPLYPPLLDAAAALGLADLPERGYLPVGYGALRLLRPLQPAVAVRYRRHTNGARAAQSGAQNEDRTVTFDVTILDFQGRPLVEIDGFTLGRAEAPEAAAVRSQTTEGAGATASAPAWAITPEDGAEAFVRFLGAATVPHVAIAARDLEALIRSSAAPVAAEAAAEAAPGAGTGGPKAERPVVATPYVAPRNEVERAIADLWQQLLGFQQVGVEDDFFELGGHSLLALQLLAAVRETFDVELAMSTLFEASTIADLAGIVADAVSQGVDEAELAELLAEMEGTELLADDAVLALEDEGAGEGDDRG